MCKSELESRARVCRCLEVRCVQVYLVSKCHVCSALVSVYKSQVLVLVRCCNSKSQVFNKSSLFNLLFNNLVLEFLLTQHILPWNPHFSSVLAPLASLPIRISSPLSATRLTNLISALTIPLFHYLTVLTNVNLGMPSIPLFVQQIGSQHHRRMMKVTAKL